jgi:hypothetical protein
MAATPLGRHFPILGFLRFSSVFFALCASLKCPCAFINGNTTSRWSPLSSTPRHASAEGPPLTGAPAPKIHNPATARYQPIPNSCGTQRIVVTLGPADPSASNPGRPGNRRRRRRVTPSGAAGARWGPGTVRCLSRVAIGAAWVGVPSPVWREDRTRRSSPSSPEEHRRGDLAVRTTASDETTIRRQRLVVCVRRHHHACEAPAC